MNTLQYGRKKRELARAIAAAVNAALRGRPELAHRQVDTDDATRKEHYSLLVRNNGGWTLFVHDQTTTVMLDMRCYGGRVELTGVRCNVGMGRISHVDTVPNQHTLAVVARLLERLSN